MPTHLSITLTVLFIILMSSCQSRMDKLQESHKELDKEWYSLWEQLNQNDSIREHYVETMEAKNPKFMSLTDPTYQELYHKSVTLLTMIDRNQKKRTEIVELMKDIELGLVE